MRAIATFLTLNKVVQSRSPRFNHINAPKYPKMFPTKTTKVGQNRPEEFIIWAMLRIVREIWWPVFSLLIGRLPVIRVSWHSCKLDFLTKIKLKKSELYWSSLAGKNISLSLLKECGVRNFSGKLCDHEWGIIRKNQGWHKVVQPPPLPPRHLGMSNVFGTIAGTKKQDLL